jgi:D-methionine transport system ATP-binding protein
VIRFERVEKSYTVGDRVHVALKRFDLEIHRGEIFGVIGESGAGKSTLLRMINGLVKPDHGNIWVEEQCVNAQTAAQLRHTRRNMGMIFQHFNLLASKTVYDNIAFPLRLRGMGELLIAARIDKILALTGLGAWVKHYPDQLSGGQKQRVAIARALVTEPHVLLCDEATSSLDPETTLSILHLLADIRATLGVTIVLITHEMQVVKTLCDRAAVMVGGEIIEVGAVLDLVLDPQHEMTARLMGASLLSKLPKVLQHNLRSEKTHGQSPVLQLIFKQKTAQEPILASIMRQYDMVFSILQAEIETIQNTIVGRLILQVQITDDAILDRLCAAFFERQVHVEVVGYVV